MYKKILLTVLAILLLGSSSALAADMGGSFYFIKKGMFEVSLQAGYINQYKMKDTDLNTSSSAGNFKIPQRDIEIKNDALAGAIVAYGLHDRINLWLELGVAGGGTLASEVTLPGGGVQSLEANLENVFAWGLGIKGKLYQQKKGRGFGLAAAMRYLRYDDRPVEGWTSEGGTSIKNIGTDTNLSLWRFDVSVSAYYKFKKKFTPYMGVRWGYSQSQFSGSWNLPGTGSGNASADYEPEQAMGLFAGMDFAFYKRWRINLQGNFLDMYALYLSASYIF